ncbi:MAG: hypothetical protein JEZ11_20965 [Desulfobacterales bacterium]|nr:hypothetical protein [Desulfobacterales bacterium]
MCDFDDDFGGFEDGGLMDEGHMDDDSMEDQFDDAMPGDDLDDTDGLDDMTVPEDTDTDGFTGEDAFFLGSAMGWAYGEGREEAERRSLLKKEWRESKKNE